MDENFTIRIYWPFSCNKVLPSFASSVSSHAWLTDGLEVHICTRACAISPCVPLLAARPDNVILIDQYQIYAWNTINESMIEPYSFYSSANSPKKTRNPKAYPVSSVSEGGRPQR